MIDIHVLTHSGTKPEWLQRCVDSLRSEPVTIHIVAGVDGSVGAGRAKGFALGQHEFVGYVDSDDYVLPGWYAKSLDLLRDNHAVVPREYVEYTDGSRHRFTKRGHNGVVYRRSQIEPLINLMPLAPLSVDVLTRRAIGPVHVDHIGYVWTMHSDGAHSKLTAEVLRQEERQWDMAMPY